MIKRKTLEEMPEFMSTIDLVTLGIYAHINATYAARLNKCSPPYIKLNHKVLYPKQGLIKWLEERTVGDK